jgi:hypothetical protein
MNNKRKMKKKILSQIIIRGWPSEEEAGAREKGSLTCM